ncbi:hypothetical protein CEXT_800931, partial [Caerostris extrusa]
LKPETSWVFRPTDVLRYKRLVEIAVTKQRTVSEGEGGACQFIGSSFLRCGKFNEPPFRHLPPALKSSHVILLMLR